MAKREEKTESTGVVWQGFPNEYSDTELRDFRTWLNTFKSTQEAEIAFGAKNSKGEVIIPMSGEKCVRPYPLELFEHKYQALWKLESREEFIEKKKMEGLEELAEGMTFQDQPISKPPVVIPKQRRGYEITRSALIAYREQHGHDYVLPAGAIIIEE